MSARNVALTGLPRSGTTLTCNLLNRLDDTVALFEPMNVKELSDFSRPLGLSRHVLDAFDSARESILSRGRAPSKVQNGRIPTGHVPPERGADGLRHGVFERAELSVDKPLAADFMLVIKHPAAFTAILEDLEGCVARFAVCRNPVSVLGSWNSVDMPIQRGRIPAGERLDDALRAELDACPDRIDRQFIVLRWFFDRFARLLPRENVIRYEDIVSSGGRALAVINPKAGVLDETFESRNRSVLYDRGLMLRLGRRILDEDGPWWSFYEAAEVERLLV